MGASPTLPTLTNGDQTFRYVPIGDAHGLERLPFSLRIVLENLRRQALLRGRDTTRQVDDLLARRAGAALTFEPSRVFGQDILGKVMLADLAALRDALAAAGHDPKLASPRIPVDIIIDHSLQVDVFARPDAARINLEREYARNSERFAFLRWCATSFPGVRVVPPGKGIMHQIHLENLGHVVWTEQSQHGPLISPDTCVGTDSHTPMINALGILGWGVGGIEAEAAMLGKPIAMALPAVVGIEVTGALRDGVTPTDLVLAITEKLRGLDVVGKFVEFFGPGLTALDVGDRGTIANMAPEYGATAVYFPIDQLTIEYLRMTARPEPHIRLIETYARAQKLWRDQTTPNPVFDTVLPLDLGDIRPCIAGPRNPEDRVALEDAATAFSTHARDIANRAPSSAHHAVANAPFTLTDGHVVIAAITSCTNTSNPTGMATAGLLARNAVAKGLRSQPWVKTSFAPGSHVVATILERAGLQASLDTLGFHVVGYGCTTCNGGSGPLAETIAGTIERNQLVATAVLSGNRNFQGRIHPNVRAAYLASPALVIAYAISGTLARDISSAPIGTGSDGQPVYLKDIWPSTAEIRALVQSAYGPAVFTEKYADLFDGGPVWEGLAKAGSDRFDWDSASTYVRQPPYFDGLPRAVPTARDIIGARPLAILGDNITTDHISPSGAISLGTPAADFLLTKGINQADFNNYTTRRANHEVAVRATFANIRLKNAMLPGVEGGMTKLMPDATPMRIFEAAQEYARRNTPLVVIAGRNYGSGSSRDWAAKGVALLGVKAIIAQGFERIHRTNLVGMGVLPLQLPEGTTPAALGLDGTETFNITGLAGGVSVRGTAQCSIHRADGRAITIPLTIRLDTPEDIDYWLNGGILPAVWRELMDRAATTARAS